ncbi:MAG TPA: VOC family protein [Longimicrobiaceae bacterium]|nr:VOC family protein [Longimicrobiaceae bacterium]
MTADASASGATPRAQPESLRARALSASITVNDLAASRDWYRDVVGFTLDRVFEHEGKLRAVALKAGAVEILLTQDDGAKGMDRKKGEGISLMLTTAQDVDEIAARIRERGGKLDQEPADNWGMRTFRFSDPDGFRFTVASERKQ